MDSPLCKGRPGGKERVSRPSQIMPETAIPQPAAASPAAGHKPWVDWALWTLRCVVILLPMVQLARLLADYTVNIPFLDDWSFVSMDEKRLTGSGWTLHDFMAGHLEHRIAFLRVVAMTCHYFWPTDYTKQTWVSYGFLCLTYLNIGLLMRRTLGEPFRRWWWLLALAGGSLCSPVQYQVFLWLILHQVTCLLFFLTAGILVWLTRWPLWLRLLLGILCAVCPTLSFATGLLVWVVLTPVILWSAPLRDARQRLWAVGGWLLAFALTVFLYFHDLKNEADPEFALGQDKTETLGAALQHFAQDPLHSLAFMARVLGGHLARGISLNLMEDALWAGLLLSALYLGALAVVARRFKDVALRERLMPWLALGAYAAAATFMVSVGRVWVTKTGLNALSARYVVHATPMMISIPVLVYLLWRWWWKERRVARPLVDWTVQAAFLVFAVSQYLGWNYGERLMENLSASRRHCATCVMFYKTGCPVEGDIDPNVSLAQRADNLHMLKPAMLTDLRLDHFLTASAPLADKFAKLTTFHLEKTEDGFTGHVEGFAQLHKHDRVADGIFLTWYDPQDKHFEIFHVTNVTSMPAYLREQYVKDLEYTDFPGTNLLDSLSHFEATFKIGDNLKPGESKVRLPREKGVLKVAAWAYDQTGGDVALIPGVWEVDPVKGTVKRLENDRAAVDFDDYVKRTGRKRRE